MATISIHSFGRPARRVATFNFNLSNRLRGGGGGGGGFSALEVEMSPVAFPVWDRPTSRDWVTLEIGADTEFVGRVVSSSTGGSAGPDGHVERDTLRVSAVGFLDIDLDVSVTPARSDVVGGLYGAERWWEEVVIPMGSQLNGPVGGTLGRFLAAAYRCQVPGTVFGFGPSTVKSLGEVVFPLYDKASALSIGYVGPVEPVQGFSPAGVQSITKASGKAVQLLTGTFQPNDQLIELTACLLRRDVGAAPLSLPIPFVGPGGQSRRRGRILGLRYRMAPFRVSPLKDKVRESVGVATSGVLPAPSTLARFDAEAFNRASWRELPVRSTSGKMVRFSCSTNGSAEVSAATAWCSFLGGGDEAKLSEVLGLPYVDLDRTTQNGLRLQTTLWPFVPPLGGGSADDGPVGADVDALTSRIAATLYQFSAPGALFESGSIELGVLSTEFSPGEVVRMPVGGRVLTAYVTGVTHAAHSDGSGHVEGTTTLSFERGLWDEALRDPDIPLTAYATRTETQAPAQVVEDPKAECVGGVPFQTDPRRDLAVIGTIPDVDWLLPFMLGAAETTGGDRMRRDIERLFAGTIGDEREHYNIRVAAASLYVIQRYWRQKFDEARVRLAGPQAFWRHESDASHSNAAGFDFYVELGAPFGAQRVSALRAWSALWKLEAAGRLAKGGKGMYLNVNPSTGIAVNDGGQLIPRNASSGTGAFAGPGGSAGTHYDFSGYFGTIDSANRRVPNGAWWLATNWDGKGRDELEVGVKIPIRRDYQGTNTATTTPDVFTTTLREVYANVADPEGWLTRPIQERLGFSATVPALRALFRPGGPRDGFDEASRVPTREALKAYISGTSHSAQDQTLFEVTEYTPNVLQVLGVEPWCSDGGE